jgi:hypothetical protein
MFTRFCALTDCGREFQTDHPTKKHCCTKHSTLSRVRRVRAKRRKGGGGGGNGGGGAPTLFDELVPVDPQALVLTGTCYRTPEVSRKPVESERPEPQRRARHWKAA